MDTHFRGNVSTRSLRRGTGEDRPRTGRPDCRSRQEEPHGTAQREESAGGPRPRMPVSGLWTAVHRCAPRQTLGGWR